MLILNNRLRLIYSIKGFLYKNYIIFFTKLITKLKIIANEPDLGTNFVTRDDKMQSLIIAKTHKHIFAYIRPTCVFYICVQSLIIIK